MCNKMGFQTASEAKAGFKASFGRYMKPKKNKVNAYLCERCGLYHITSMTKAQIRNMLKRRKQKQEARKQDD